MVVADGGFRRSCTTVADNRAMFEWRLLLARSQMSSLRDAGQSAARCHPPSARYADLETGSGAEMPVVSDATLFTASVYDQTHEGAGNCALRVGASGRGEVT
jgi:hypothetical protein